MSTPYYSADDNGNAAPIIVQGQIVEPYNPHHQGPQNSAPQSLEYEAPTSQPQSKCQDAFWALLYYVHLAALAFCTIRFVPVAVQDLGEDYGGAQQGRRFLEEQEDSWTLDPQAIFWILILAGVAGCIWSSLAMLLLLKWAQGLIQVALVWNIVVNAVLVLLCILGAQLGMALMFGIGLAFSVYWCYVVWPKIPFAAANLVTATTAVRANLGLAVYAFISLFLTFAWSLWWALAFVSTSYVLGDCAADGTCQNELNGGLVFLFLVSYFWTAQVLKNVVHTTVAGTVGTFWFAPLEANGCCSRAVRDSYIRSITTSFGSICLGSLIVAIIQALKEIMHSLREQDDSILACIAECILGLIQSIVEYFNQWAFVYVGLYNYSFMEAGKKVMELFRARGWTSIIADMLVDTVLLMIALGVAVLTGVVGVIVGRVIEQDNSTLVAAFFVGMGIGFFLCSTLFSLISSAVNATVVLYAEAPAEFQHNHPQLANQMREAWRKAYPTEFHY